MLCDKRTYETREDAADDLAGLRIRNKRHKFSVYRCPHCKKFHITTITKKILRPRKKDKYPIEIYSRTEPKQKSKRKNKKGGK